MRGDPAVLARCSTRTGFVRLHHGESGRAGGGLIIERLVVLAREWLGFFGQFPRIYLQVPHLQRPGTKKFFHGGRGDGQPLSYPPRHNGRMKLKIKNEKLEIGATTKERNAPRRVASFTSPSPRLCRTSRQPRAGSCRRRSQTAATKKDAPSVRTRVKVRSDSKLHRLTASQRKKLEQWLFVENLSAQAVADKCNEEFHAGVNEMTVLRYYHREKSGWDVEQRAKEEWEVDLSTGRSNGEAMYQALLGRMIRKALVRAETSQDAKDDKLVAEPWQAVLKGKTNGPLKVYL